MTSIQDFVDDFNQQFVNYYAKNVTTNNDIIINKKGPNSGDLIQPIIIMTKPTLQINLSSVILTNLAQLADYKTILDFIYNYFQN